MCCFGKILVNTSKSHERLACDARGLRTSRKPYLLMRSFCGMSYLDLWEHEIVNGIHARLRARDRKHDAVDEKRHQ